MIVCINCSAETKRKMDSLLKKDQYKDYSELIAVAVDNLWLLDREFTEKGDLFIMQGAESSDVMLSDPATVPTKQGKHVKQSSATLKRKTSRVAVPSVDTSPPRIPELFHSIGRNEYTVAKQDVSSEESGTEKPYTLDRWLFGQYNKLLPAKANCRALIRIMANHPDGAKLEEVAHQIAEAAALLGNYLADHDRRHQIDRDNALATAFPRSGPDAEKSCSRYATQFVGSVNSQGILSGLLSDYCLAALVQDKDARLLPTEPAVQFAQLTNPVLDSCQTDPKQKFSPEEVAFILEHIRFHVPVEAFAFRTLIQAIIDGANTPDKLDEALRSLVPTDTNRSLSPSFLTSQRSGALSRMADIGLVERLRKGVKVSYHITAVGDAFMES